MYIFLSLLVLCVFLIIIIKMFMQDKYHDLEIVFGKYKFSMKKHDKE